MATGEALCDQLKSKLAALEARCTAFEQMLQEREDRNKERFNAIDYRILHASDSTDKAVIKAEMAIEKRFESVNEFRAALSDQALSFMPRQEYAVQHAALLAVVDTMIKRTSEIQLELSRLIERTAGQHEGIGKIGAIVLGIVAVIASFVSMATLTWDIFKH